MSDSTEEGIILLLVNFVNDIKLPMNTAVHNQIFYSL